MTQEELFALFNSNENFKEAVRKFRDRTRGIPERQVPPKGVKRKSELGEILTLHLIVCAIVPPDEFTPTLHLCAHELAAELWRLHPDVFLSDQNRNVAVNAILFQLSKIKGGRTVEDPTGRLAIAGERFNFYERLSRKNKPSPKVMWSELFRLAGYDENGIAEDKSGGKSATIAAWKARVRGAATDLLKRR